MRLILLPLVLASALFGATSIVSITPTATQARIQVKTDQPGNCTFQVSEGASIGTLVNDVNTSLFAGSNSDARAPYLITGSSHIFIAGNRIPSKATNGLWKTRALQANTLHTVQGTCGSDNVTQSFFTRNPQLGDLAPETLSFDTTAPYNAVLPSIDMSMTGQNDTGQASTYIDQTGIQMVRITGPMQGGQITTNNAAITGTVFDPASAWTNPQNAISNSVFATIGTAGSANALFIPLGFGANITSNNFPYGKWDSRAVIDDLNISLNASGSSATAADRVMQACIKLHATGACATDTITISNIPQTTPTQVNFPNTPSPTVWNPFWKLWTTSHPYPAAIDLGTRTGTATMSGTTITWASSDLFPNTLIAGDRIKLVGSACSNGGTDFCTVASVTDSKHVVTVESKTVSSAAAFTINNAGLSIWKNNANGTVSINTATYYTAIGTSYGTAANEQKDTCSPVTFSLPVFRDGSTRTPAVPARLCQFQAATSANAAYVFVPSTGEAWHIANGVTTFPGPGPGGSGSPDQINTGPRCTQDGPSWHPTDPFSWYCANRSGTGFYVVLKFTYNYVVGAGSCNGREWNDVTYGSVIENPCVGIVNDTPASLGQNIEAKILAVDPTFTTAAQNYFLYNGGTGGGPVGGVGKYLLFGFTSASQNTLGYMAWYDTQSKTIVKVANTYSTSPMRWSTLHGALLVHDLHSDWSRISINYQANYRSGQTGQDKSEMAIVSIAGRGDNNLPSNYFTACPAGLDARWQALGATAGAMKCVQITMDGEPRMQNPSANDKAFFPASPLNAAWTQIQPLIEGDEIQDNVLGAFSEGLLVVRKTAGTGNQIVLDILRAPQWQTNGVCPAATSHTAWVPIMIAAQQCGSDGYWVNVTGSAATVAEDVRLGTSHLDSSGIGPNGGLTVTTGLTRAGAFPAAINTNSPYSTIVYQPPFNGSNPLGSGSFVAQSHPSSRQVTAPLSEQGWAIDGHPYAGGTVNGSFTPLCTLGAITLQGGTSTVYKLTLAGGSCPATLDMKNFPLEVTAGRFLMGDISSAATGNQVTDSTPYRWCYTAAVNECRTGSAIGDVYAAIPFGETGTACSYVNFDINSPCVFAKYGLVGNIVQWDVSNTDSTGAGARKLGHGLTVPTHAGGFWSGTSDPDGKWAFFGPVLADNMVVAQYFAYKLPPQPARDSNSRNQYTDVPMQLSGISGDTIRVRYGYQELGAVDGSANSLYCTSRTESCYSTAAPSTSTPFLYAGETQSYVSCNGPCVVHVQAIPNRMMFYTVERKNGSNVKISTVQPPIAVN
jgi:hypothetical protein